MKSAGQCLTPSRAARRLGLSAKALRIYERHGLIAPSRTAAGWRAYGPAEMERLAEIAALRALGLTLAQIGRVLRGEPESLEPALALHEAALEGRIRQLADSAAKVRSLRAEIAEGKAPVVSGLARLATPASDVAVSFDLPWPWGGERFELRGIRRLTYIVGPLFSGKTRLAQAIAQNLPHTTFIGLERSAEDLKPTSRVEQVLNRLLEEGATASPALVALIAALESEGASNRVVDMVEQGLDRPTQRALMAYLRRRGPESPLLFLMTRSTAILNLADVGPEEAILFCPANHSVPIRVAPYPGAPGYEAVVSCLASPEVRARTEGVIAVRHRVA